MNEYITWNLNSMLTLGVGSLMSLFIISSEEIIRNS